MCIQIKKEYNYNNVFMIPKKTIVDSRSQCDTSVQFGPKKFDLPIVAANMKSVINEQTCKYFAEKNLFYIMHRYGISNIEFIDFMNKNNLYTSISIGVDEDSYCSLNRLCAAKLNPDYITIDIANGWSVKTEKMVKFIKDKFSSFLIVGNVATKEAVCDLQEWGANAIKVGIAGGKSCITKLKTSFHRPMINTIIDCSDCSFVPIIADGGITEHGHISLAIACGAKMVMSGYLMSGYDQSAGNILEIEDRQYKEYFGSASQYNKGSYKNVEGKKILIPYRGNMDKFLNEVKEDIQSSISYSGGNKLFDLCNVDLVFSE